VYDQLGKVQGRTGSSTDWTVPRNAYKTRDGKWLGLSASSQSIAERVMHLVGHPEIVDEPWFGDHNGRVENQHILDEHIGSWIAAHDYDDVLAAFEAQQAVIGPIYSIADIFKDPQYIARDTITTVDDPKLGKVRIQNAIPRLVDTPGRVRHLGGDLGQDNREILIEGLGHTAAEIERLRKAGVVGGPPIQEDD
jgi:crotonobetainyl-CoA:carnitine CoA-transferase CaiB-like acyl-CoA transferase